MTIIVTLLAFIINVGLFVKAKINLQNAVDAAAWAGAAVQARQLTNIGYLNWEMRNNYKEWMFKQYVFGQIALKTVADTSTTGAAANNMSPNNMQFRGKPFDSTNYPDEYEKFNLPTTCIHFGTGHNICDIVRLPGLPRFNTVGLPSISSHHESVLSSLVDTKAKDCSRRTSVNFGAALLWAYGTGSTGGLSFSQMPLIASSRVGSWIKGMELGLRMRNLEAQVNLPPMTGGICDQCSDGTPIGDIDTTYAANERPIKAFLSAYRNLGGGDVKGTELDEFSTTFKLTELEPNKVEFSGSKTLSNYLIPNNPTIGGLGYNPSTKYYLDLQAYPINYVSFFTTFVSQTQKYNGTSVDQEADCGGSKTGMPVPGFMFGFVKNHEMMTYYAVKGEAKFTGLFYPFSATEGITLNAYAAAKPFGGRVGPRIFGIQDNKIVIARQENSANKSAAYIGSIEIPATMRSKPLAERYRPGTPVPLTENFWVQSDTDPIGGSPDAGDVFFAIPNLLYDYTDDGDMNTHVEGSLVNEIRSELNLAGARNPKETFGLHNKTQFNLFKANYSGSSVAGSIIAQDNIEHSINLVRRATKYDAVNYLVPVLYDNSLPMENVSSIKIEPGCNFPPVSNPPSCVSLYAPLYGDGTMFNTPTATSDVITESVDRFKPAIEKFIAALEEVHDSLKAQSSKDPTAYVQAAESIYKPGGLPGSGAPLSPACVNAALSQNFHHFFMGSSKSCDITPITDLILQYFGDANVVDSTYVRHPMVIANDNTPDSLMTAYMPGVRRGAQDDGSVPGSGPLSASADVLSSRRNFYSTKFVPLQRLIGGPDGYAKDGQWMFIERGLSSPPVDIVSGIKNHLKKSDLDIWDKLFF